MHEWFNRQVPRCLYDLKLLDSEGLFIGDASYLFVPDNEHYEKSVELLFDEHNHRVDPQEVDLRDKRYQWPGCYKMVSLIHVNRAPDYFLVAAARLVPDSLPQPRTLLGMVRGVSSWTSCPLPLTAVINREINPEGEVQDWVLVTTAPSWSAAHTPATYKLRPAIEERHRQYKCFWSLAPMTSRNFSLVLAHALFVLRAYTLFQGHLFLRHLQELNRRTRPRILERLGPTVEVVAVYYRQRFCLLLLPEFAEILLEVAEAARAKLLRKMRLLKRDVYDLLETAGSP